MPYLIVDELQEKEKYNIVIKIPREIISKYPIAFKAVEEGLGVSARTYLDRVYNTNGDIIKEYKQMIILHVKKGSYTGEYLLDFTPFHLRDGIPIGYFIGLLLLSLIIKVKEGKKIEIPVLPNEFKTEVGYSTPDRVKEFVKMEEYTLEKVGRDIEVIGLLYDIGLAHIAGDLTEALSRFYKGDYEGSIKFFRKVVEGLRNLVQSKKIMIVNEKRTESLRQYLAKAYHLLSNFGEHAGTYGFMPEATFSKDIALSACRYFVSHLRRPQ